MALRYYRDMDDLLGDRSSRYFGDGYLRTNQKISDFRLVDQGGGLTFSCLGSVITPDLWSAKDGTIQKPHLSTIDVLELSRESLRLMLERTLHHADLSASTVERIDIVAGNEPVETALEAVAIEGKIVRDETPKGVLTVKIANMVVTMAFSLNVSEKDRKIGDGKQAIAVSEIMLHKAGMRATGMVEPATARAGEAWSVESCFSAGLQMGQALLYALDDIDRQNSNTLWMKRTSLFILPTTPDVGAPQPVATKLENVRRYEKADGEWRRADINSFMANIGIVCSVTHRLPA